MTLDLAKFFLAEGPPPMRVDAFIPLVGAIVNLALAVFVLIQNPRTTVSRVFFLMGLSFAVWNYGTYWMFVVETKPEAYFWARFLTSGVIWIPITLFHISFLIAGIKIPRRVLWGAYALHGLLFLSNFTRFFLRDVRRVSYAWYSKAGPGFWILFGIFALMWVSVVVLILHRRKLPRLMRRRLTPLIIAQSGIAIFGTNDALPILHQDYYPWPFPFHQYQIYPFGSMAAILYGLIVGYSVLQHQLLNVHVVLGRYSAHLVRMFFLFLTGFCLLLVTQVLTRTFDNASFLAALVVLVASTLIASTLFPRLMGGVSESFERRLLGDHFEYEDQVQNFIKTMAWHPDLSSLQAELHNLLVRTFRLASYRIVLHDATTHSFNLVQSYPEEPSRPLPDFQFDSPIFRYFDGGKHDYLSLNPEQVRFSPSATERRARLQLRSFQSEFCFPLTSQTESLGLLIVGGKSNSDPYTTTDIRLLISLAENLSVVINQIRLKTQILQAQELDLLGRMSRGMAHDLNNLLTPVSTLLQLSEESGALDEELLPVAARNLAMMRSYIREALFFSENLRPDIQIARLDALLRQAIEVASNSRKKEVRIVPAILQETVIEADGVLIQRLVANLITNAIDASPIQGEVVVALESLGRIDGQRDWVRVRVIDHGEGISRENLGRVFTPYFTTKNRGDANRGFGLGLAICRKIAALHGGALSIDSHVKRGTAVQLDLPLRQASPTEPTFSVVSPPTQTESAHVESAKTAA